MVPNNRASWEKPCVWYIKNFQIWLDTNKRYTWKGLDDSTFIIKCKKYYQLIRNFCRLMKKRRNKKLISNKILNYNIVMPLLCLRQRMSTRTKRRIELIIMNMWRHKRNFNAKLSTNINFFIKIQLISKWTSINDESLVQRTNNGYWQEFVFKVFSKFSSNQTDQNHLKNFFKKNMLMS